MEVIIELFEIKRICQSLRRKGWQLTYGLRNDEVALLKFSRIPKSEGTFASSNIVDLLKQMGDLG
jgi:hypothetical protein